MSPTCATSSPSFEYRIGAGWAGTQVSLLQPQANASFSPRPATLPPIPRLPLPGHRARNARPRRGRTEGRTDTRPRSASAAPTPGPAQSGTPPTCQQARSRPRPAPPAASQPPRLGRRPPPTPRGESSSARLAGSCRVLSPPPNLAPSLPPEPPFESAHAAPHLIGWGGRTRGQGRGAESAREGGAGAGAGRWKPGLELAGVGKEPGASGEGAGPGLGGPRVDGRGSRVRL